MTSRFGAAFAALLLTLTLSPLASGQTLRLNLVQLEQTSDTVVMGRTVRSESEWAADRSAILTRVTIEVQDPTSGATIGEQVVLVPGGQVGEYVHEVSDMPSFRLDEEVAVFLTRHASGEMIVTGGWQGKLDVEIDEESGERRVLGAAYLLSESVEGFARKDEAHELDASRAAMTVGEFANKVRKLKRER